MSMTPPPLPYYETEQEPSEFAVQAANVCAIAPFVAIGISWMFGVVLKDTMMQMGQRLAFMVLGLTVTAVLGMGVIAGLLAMFMARSGQRGRVFAKVAIGVVPMALLVVIAVPNFVRARTAALQNRAALAKITDDARDVREQSVAYLNGTGEKVDTRKMEKTLNQAAANSSGDMGALFKGAAAWYQELDLHKRAYESASTEFVNAKVLSTRNLVQRDQVTTRKAIVNRFLSANTSFKNYLANSENNFRQQLTASQMSPLQKEAALRGFHRSFGSQTPIIMQIRNDDDRLGRASLGALELLEANWDRWNYDESSGKVIFQDHAAVVQYNAFMREINAARDDQLAAQKRLAAAISKTPETM